MKQLRFGAMVLVILLLLGACEKLTQPRLGPETFALQELSTLVTETYLKLKGIDRFSGGTLKLYRNDKALWERPLTLADTVLYDSTLQPTRRYTYRAELWAGHRRLAQSAPITVTTMDTTSHDFEWEIIEFPSPYGSGALYDVAIIDENDIWAVGEIYSDSAQPWLPYNAVHWNGERWELKRIYKENNNAIQAIRGILTFDGNKFWFAAGSIYYWDKNSEENATLVYRRDVSTWQTVEKLWGTLENNIYGVGNQGLIVHYDGHRWWRIESGTDVDLSSISGTSDSRFIWVAGVKRPTEYGVILQIRTDLSVETLFSADRPLFGPGDDHIHSTAVWLNGKFGYGAYAGLDDTRLVRHRLGAYDKDFRVLHTEPQGAIRCIDGNGANDWFAVGTRDVVLHYNGVSMKKFFRWPTWDIRYYSVDVKGDMVAACGMFFTNPNAALLLGKRKKR